VESGEWRVERGVGSGEWLGGGEGRLDSLI
jgi:hypothetical protein